MSANKKGRPKGRAAPPTSVAGTLLGLLFRMAGRLITLALVLWLLPYAVVFSIAVYFMLALLKLALTPPKGSD